MDADLPNSLWTPNMALRSKEQVLLEEFNTTDFWQASKKRGTWMEEPGPADLKTWTTLKLPYQARLSPPIPSMKDIRQATASDALHYINGGHSVCRMGGTVIKYSYHDGVVEEAENLLFLAEKRPELRIPKVLAVWSTTEEGRMETFCLMMDFIEGIQLNHERFAKLPIHAQDTICAKVSSQIRYLRELDSEGYYGRVHRQGWLSTPVGLWLPTGTSKTVLGPFKTYEEFISAVYRTDQVRRATSNPRPEWRPVDVENAAKLRSIFPGWNPHEPKLTWVDPKITNMIARQINGDEGSEDWEVFLIDWECTGWYPAWVQGLQCLRRSHINIFDYTKPPKNRDYGYPSINYRKPEIVQMIMKDFEPDPDHERVASINELGWVFF